MITNKHIKELEKRYVGKRIVLDQECNYGDFAQGLTGVITGVSPSGQLKFDVDGGICIYLTSKAIFHILPYME